MKLEDLTGRLAFITGGASGIGLGMAQALAAVGMSIAVADIDQQAAEEAAAGLMEAGAKAAAVQLDVQDRAAWGPALDAAERQFGALTVFCSNAGVAGSRMPVAQTDPRAWDWTIGINLTGTFNALQAALPRLQASGRPGHIVATASLGGFLVQPGNGTYSASKAAVIALCEALRGELLGTAINISVLCPGFVRSKLLQANAARLPGVLLGLPEPELEAMLQAGTDPREIGEFVVNGILASKFWLFPHPELRNFVQARSDEIATSHELD